MNFLITEECKKCNLYKNDKHPCQKPSGSEKAEIYILTETPKDLRGEYGELIFENFKKFGYPIEKLRLNFATACDAKQRKVPTDKQIALCRDNVLLDIDKVKPKVIIAFGSCALKSIFENNKIEGGIQSLRGRNLMWREKNCWVIPTITPEKVIQLDNWNGSKRFFRDDIRKAIKYRDIQILIKPNFEIFTITDFEQICDILNEIKYASIFSFDIETSCQRPYQEKAKILSISFSIDGKTGFSFPISYREFDDKTKEKNKIISLIKEIMENSKSTKIIHNEIFEREWLKVLYDMNINGKVEDTMLQAYSIDCRSKTHNLEFQVWEHFGLFWKNETEKYKNNMEEAPLDLLLDRNAKDSVFTFLLCEKQNKIIKEKQKKLYEDFLLPTSKTLTKMQIEGLLVNQDALKELIKNYTDKLTEIKEKLYSLPEIDEFKIKYGFIPKLNANTKDLKTIFFEIKKLKPIKFTEKQNPSQDTEFLEYYAIQKDIFCELLLEYREYSGLLNKLQGQFTECIFNDGKYHPNFNLTFTVSGRLSCGGPSLQNVDKQKHPEMRGIITVPDGYIIMSVDQSQLEARNIAMISKDKNFIEVIKKGYDIHQEKAQELFKNNLNGKSRFMAKNSFVFPSFYGASYKSCAKNMGLSEEHVKKVQNRLWQQFPEIKKWQKKVKDFYNKYGYIETVTGRIRLGPMSYNEMINHMIQGPSSDIILIAMNKLQEKDYKLVINVHDELVFYVKEDKIEHIYKEIKEIMEGVRFEWMLDVPLTVECKIGLNWYDLVPINDILK